MNYKRVKHSKYKNTGLIFEFLLRQITSDLLNDGKEKEGQKYLAAFYVIAKDKKAPEIWGFNKILLLTNYFFFLSSASIIAE